MNILAMYVYVMKTVFVNAARIQKMFVPFNVGAVLTYFKEFRDARKMLTHCKTNLKIKQFPYVCTQGKYANF